VVEFSEQTQRVVAHAYVVGVSEGALVLSFAVGAQDALMAGRAIHQAWMAARLVTAWSSLRS